MDFLLENQPSWKKIYYSAANTINLEVDLLYLDTTSTYFETAEED